MTALRAALLALLAALALAAPAGAQAPPAVPDTPAGQQLAWLLDASRRLPLSEEEARAHFAPDLLAAVPLPVLNPGLAEVSGTSGLTLESVAARGAGTVRAIVASSAGRFELVISVDPAGLIASAGITPYADPPRSWRQLDARLRALAPEVSFLAAEGDACTPVHALAPRTQRPLGSAFKLYVLGALAEAVRAGRARWEEPLAIRERWKSLPSGRLQDAPVGTRLPLREHAALMISISDNTATDHLMGRLGRGRIERQLARFRHARPALNRPFLTTRELFALKGTTAARQRAYVRARGERARRRLLPRLARVPRSAVTPWTRPRAIRTIEWFGSARDLCRAYAGLGRQARTPGLEPVGRILSLNDGGLGLDPASWPEVWFKGGSEPGVLTLAYRLRAADGRVLTLAALAADPRAPLPPGAEAEMLALVRGAVALAGP